MSLPQITRALQTECPGVGCVAFGWSRQDIDRFAAQRRQQLLDAVSFALELCRDVNEINEAGQTALHGGAAIRSADVMQLLLTHGANADVKDAQQLTPFDIVRRAHEDAPLDAEARRAFELVQKVQGLK